MLVLKNLIKNLLIFGVDNEVLWIPIYHLKVIYPESCGTNDCVNYIFQLLGKNHTFYSVERLNSEFKPGFWRG